MKNLMLVVGMGMSLLASVFMAYGKVFLKRETREEQSGILKGKIKSRGKGTWSDGTRFAQIGAVLLIARFSIQIDANVVYET
jgi:hypothetical protein